MNNTRFLGLFALIFMFLAVPPRVQASHIYGAEAEYECVAGCTMRIHFRLYRDCSGSASINLPTGLTLNPPASAPTCALPTGIGTWAMWSIVEITPVGPGIITRCQSAGATMIGVQEYSTYRDYSYCSSTCSSFTFDWSTCCRTPAATSIIGASSQSLYVEDFMASFPGGVCNNSPEFRGNPVILVCDGQSNQVFDMGADDPEGDSLAYSLAACKGLSGSLPYNTGYTPTEPLGPNWDVTLDGQTGTLIFSATPGGNQAGPVCVLVEEYRNGVLIGTLVRDMQVFTYNCGCVNIRPQFSGLSHLTSGSPGPNYIYAPAGDTLCFRVNVTDSDNNLGGYTWLSGRYPPLPGAYLADTNGVPMDSVEVPSGPASPVAMYCWPVPTAGTHDVEFFTGETSCITSQIYRDTFYMQIAIVPGDSVWPGDANDDLIANNSDILAVGLGFGNTGAARPGATLNWVGQYNSFWNDTLPSGVNMVHTDCDGNGIITFADTAAISLNYGLTHNKNILGPSQTTAGGGIPLYLDFPTDSVGAGDTVEVGIFLGDASAPATSVYGLAYTVNYDSSLVDTAVNVRIDYDSSWFAGPNTSISLTKNFFDLQRAETGFSRIDHTARTGMGQIGSITIVMTDNIDGKTFSVVADTFRLALSNVTLIGADGEILPVEVRNDSVIVWDVVTEQEPIEIPPADRLLSLYPNPASTWLTLETRNLHPLNYSLLDMQGRVCRSAEIHQSKTRISVHGLPGGVYFLRVELDTGERITRKIMLN